MLVSPHLVDRHLGEPISLATAATVLSIPRSALAGGFAVTSAARSAKRFATRGWAGLGFYDQAHMGRLLKRQIGLTPEEVRAAAAP